MNDFTDNTIPVSPYDEQISNQATRRMTRVISVITALLVILLACGCFVLSFEALSQFAASSGALTQGHAWVFPLVVDGSIVVFSVSALRCSIVGEDGRWPMALVILATAASVLFNIGHAPAAVMPALVTAMPPLLLFLSFESLMRQIRSSLGDVAAMPKAKTKKASPPKTKVAQNTSTALSEARKVEALRLLAEGVSKRNIARQLNMGFKTVQRLIHKEGHRSAPE